MKLSIGVMPTKMGNVYLVSLALGSVSLLDRREHVGERARVGLIDSALVVVTKRPAGIVTAIVLTLGVNLESIEGVLEVQLFEVAVVFVEVVLMPVPDMALSCVFPRRLSRNTEVLTHRTCCPSTHSGQTAECGCPQ